MFDKPYSLFHQVADREGHDECYWMDCTKIEALGWRPTVGFDEAIERTVRWYADNRWWWEKIKSGDYGAFYERQYGERLAAARPYAG